MSDTTVLVIGGGGTGVGTARDLAFRGVDVTLVERGDLAGETSGSSHGLLHSGARYAESDPEGAAECIRENEILRNIAGECIKISVITSLLQHYCKAGSQPVHWVPER